VHGQMTSVLLSRTCAAYSVQALKLNVRKARVFAVPKDRQRLLEDVAKERHGRLILDRWPFRPSVDDVIRQWLEKSMGIALCICVIAGIPVILFQHPQPQKHSRHRAHTPASGTANGTVAAEVSSCCRISHTRCVPCRSPTLQ
jgi:hypothetical protein